MDAFLFYFYIFRANGSETRPVPGGFIWLAGGLARGAGGGGRGGVLRFCIARASLARLGRASAGALLYCCAAASRLLPCECNALLLVVIDSGKL